VAVGQEEPEAANYELSMESIERDKD
jgi:hypothetical protein